MGDIDWPEMRGSILVLLGALIVSVSLVSGALYFYDAQERQYQSAKGKLSSIRANYQTIDDQRKLIENYLPRFKALEQQGIVGAERRLQWIETLRTVAERVKLPELRYQIERQLPYDAGFPINVGSFRIFSTGMRINMSLLHEDDFVRTLRRLERGAAGLHQIDSCEFRRATETFVRVPDARNVTVACRLRWLAIDKREAAS